jgi:hypothetical protein
MFQKEYTFYGSHADKVKSLVSKFSDHSGSTLFQRNVDVLLFAPIVGLLYGRTGVLEKSKTQTTKIFAEQMIKEDLRIKFNYQLVTLLDKKSDIGNDQRIDSAFRNIGNDDSQSKLDQYNAYILGGVEVLYEKIIESAKTEQGYLAKLYDFLDDINDRYNLAIKKDRVSELLALARSQD